MMRSNLLSYVFVWEHTLTDFLETIDVNDLTVGT